jgi:hypothetical protein
MSVASVNAKGRFFRPFGRLLAPHNPRIFAVFGAGSCLLVYCHNDSVSSVPQSDALLNVLRSGFA